MSSVSEGNSITLTIPIGRTLRVDSAGEALIVDGTKSYRASPGFPVRWRPSVYSYERRVTIRALSGAADYTIFYTDVIPFTGDRTLTAEDDGKVLRCDDASNVTITVPADLPECFSVVFLMWSTGTITVEAGSGATKRSDASELSTQYQSGALLVTRNADDASAEFVLNGGFA